MSQQIWNKICIAHVILGIRIKIEKLSAGKHSIYTHISGWHTFCFGALSSLTAIRWRRWGSRPRWHWSWWRCTRAFAPPGSLWIHCCAILARKTAVRLIFPNYCQVSFLRSLHLDMLGKHNTPLLLFSNFGPWLFDKLLRFLHCGARNPFFGHFHQQNVKWFGSHNRTTQQL